MNKSLSILFVEDSESDSALVLRHIERAGYELRSLRVDDIPGLEAGLREHEWDVILCDNNLPQLNATIALERLLRFGRDVPFIIVSNAIGDEAAVALLKAGAHDYVLKGNLTRLISVIEREIEDANNRKQAKLQDEKIRTLSNHLMQLAETERAEIARELHDSVGQSLVLLKLNLIKFLQHNELRDAANEALLIDPVNSLLDELRGISRRLTPSHMKKVGMQLAIEDMLSTAAEMSGVRLTADIAALEGFFPENWSIQCFRIVQEAVTNALKHSGADEIRVSARKTDGNLELCVSDNGKGIASAGDRQGIGLALMQERVASLRGQLHLENSTAGLTVRLLIPAQDMLDEGG